MKKNLELGKIYPSIKVMCEILEIEYKDNNNSRKANLKQIERYYSLEKQGRKYKVLEKYDTPKEKLDGRKNNGGNVSTTKYDDLLDQLLLDWLLEENVRGNVDTTKNNLFVENDDEFFNIPLFKEGYKELLSMGYEEFSEKENMSKGLVLTYMQKVNKVVETSLLTVLNRLQKQNIIQWQKDIKAKYYSTDEIDIVDEEMKNEIIEVERDTYKKLDMTPFERVNPKMNKKFITAVCSNFNDISSYWRVFNIDIINEEFVNNSELNDEQRIEIRDELITRYVKSVVEAVKNKPSKEDQAKRNIFGKKKIETIYKPYASPKYVDDINELNKMIWILPDGYKTDDEEIFDLSEDMDMDWTIPAKELEEEDLPW